MKILSVYQARTFGADGKLPKSDYVSYGCAPDDMALFEAAPALLKELEHLVRLLEPLEANGTLAVPGLATLNGARAAIAAARGPWSNKA